MGGGGLENVKRVLQEKLNQSLSQNHTKTSYYFGDFGLGIYMGHVFLSWILLECSETYATKRNPFRKPSSVTTPFLKQCLEAALYTQKNTVCVVCCSVYKDITSDIQQLLNV